GIRDRNVTGVQTCALPIFACVHHDAPMTYRYKPEVLEQLSRHGAQPTPATPPQLVHDFVNDLYRYELRRLRDRLVRREVPKVGRSEERRVGKDGGTGGCGA